MKNKIKQPTLMIALMPIIVMAILLSIGGAMMGLRVEFLLLITTAFTGGVAVYLGYSWEDIISSIQSKVSKTLPALLILLMVGLLIGTWIIGGTIPLMVKIGMGLISPKYLVITAFVVTAFISICIGTSWGAVSTVGVALMSVAVGMDARLDIVAGAVVSGAYLGDKMSPLSDTTNLASIAAGSKLYEHIGHMVYTTGPAALIAAIVYLTVGLSGSGDVTIPAGALDDVMKLDEIYNFNILMLLPVVIILYGSIRKKPTIPVMMISGFVAILNGIFIHGFSVADACNSAVTGVTPEMFETLGYTATEISGNIHTLLIRGGMLSMLGTLLMALCALFFAGVISVTGSLEVVLRGLLNTVTSCGGLILATVVSCLVTIGITSNGQVSILLPGELFRDSYKKFGLKAKNLSRTLEDSATVIEPILPWTVSGLFMAETLGVSTLEYLPWAVLCYTGVVFALIWGYTGFGIARLDSKKS